MSFAVFPGVPPEVTAEAMGQKPAPEAESTAKRARVAGKFKADDPATAAVNEAWKSAAEN